MHPTPDAPNALNSAGAERITWYHWLVVVVASLGWLFDCMDQRIFILARESALTAVVTAADAAREARTVGGGTEEGRQVVGRLGHFGIMMIGWATGGIIFGIMGDRWAGQDDGRDDPDLLGLHRA